MFHTKVTLPESHPDYPSITQSQCGSWRVVRCPDYTFSFNYTNQREELSAIKSYLYTKEYNLLAPLWGPHRGFGPSCK